MAKGNRVKIGLKCSECGDINYSTVKNAKTHKEWRAEYMTLEMHYQEKYEEGLEEGRAEGRVEGSVKTLIALVKKGKLTISEAAEEAEMTEKEFEELLKSAED